MISALHGDYCGILACPEPAGATSRSECPHPTGVALLPWTDAHPLAHAPSPRPGTSQSNRNHVRTKNPREKEGAMTTQTVENPAAKSRTSPVGRGFRHLFRPDTSFNLLLAIENDDNAPAAIRVTDALIARGAVPSVVRATDLMIPVPGTPDSMVFYASAVLGEDFHETQVHSVRELIKNTIGDRQWPVASLTGDPVTCITDEAEAEGSELLVMGIHQHGAFEQAIGDNTATRVMGHAAVPVLGVRPGLSGLPRKIMVPTDFGDASREAAHLAANLADPGGSVVLVHASIPTTFIEEGDEGAALIQREGIEHAFLHLTDEISKGKSIRVETVSRAGDAIAQVMAAAALISPDLIAMASQRHSLITRLILGSVTRKVVREGHWPMLITPPARS